MMPLARFTILDLTRVRSGPTCVRQLADWGANVIKIEATDEVDTGKGLGGERAGREHPDEMIDVLLDCTFDNRRF